MVQQSPPLMGVWGPFSLWAPPLLTSALVLSLSLLRGVAPGISVVESDGSHGVTVTHYPLLSDHRPSPHPARGCVEEREENKWTHGLS